MLYSFKIGYFGPEFKNELNINLEFMKLVKEYIDLKNSMPENINDNPIILEEFNQIKYLINLILTVPVNNIIISTIYKQMIEMDALNVISKDKNKLLNEIIQTEFDRHTIYSYLSERLPLLAIKYFTTIYNNSGDIDKKYNTANDLFTPIINIIKSNKIIQITDESIIIRNFRQYLLPFLITTYQNFITTIRLTIYSFEKYLLNKHISYTNNK